MRTYEESSTHVRRLAGSATEIGALLTVLGVMANVACVQPESIVLEPLRIVNWAPASATTCVDTDVDILVTFSSDLDPNSLTGDSLELINAEGRVSTTITYDPDTYTVTLTPDENLAYDTLFAVRAQTGITTIDADNLPVNLDSSFQTTGRLGCSPVAECRVASECSEEQLCSSVGTCIAECLTSQDCPGGMSCDDGVCT